jgi:outer membrane protein insertion porin family
LWPKIFECHNEVILMHKLRGRIVFDYSAKKASLLHGCNLALLGLLLCTTLLAGAHPPQELTQSPVQRVELLSYEGQNVSSVELAGQPDLNVEEMMPLVAQRSGEEFSGSKIEQTLATLQGTGKFKDVQLDLRPEQEGVRVVFVLQPAIYFGMYQFPGAERFPYSRLILAANYVQQEPYSSIDIQKARESLLTFLQRNGYFRAEVMPEVEVDKANGLANVNFRVKLNKLAKFGDVRIQGTTTPDETEHLKGTLRSLRARIKSSAIREGKDYSLKTLQNATQYLESHLQNENRLGAQVKLTGADYNPETNRADIAFDIQPGPPVHAIVEGVHLWPWTRHKLLPVYQQNGLAPELIQEGRQNLLKKFREKGFFDVQVETETKARPDGITILYMVKKGDRKKIDDVAFTGNSNFGEDELKQHVNVQEAGLLSKGSYNESSVKTLQAFYQSKGFNEVKVTPQFNTHDGNVIVAFAVNEGPQDTVDAFHIEGNTSVSLEQFAPDGLRLAPGQPYAQKSIDDDRNKIMSYYLEHGYLTATFNATAEPSSSTDPHKFAVVYKINEGPQVKTSNILTVGNNVTKEALIAKQTRPLKVGLPLTEREILESESRLFATGVFDWAEVNPRRQITSQEQEDVIVKVHESKRNSMTYGFGYELVNKGGSVPTGTVALPGLPPVGLPGTFKTNQRRVSGPRVNFQYTRSNVRGKAETITLGGLYGPLDRRASIVFSDPNFRWTDWTASLTTTLEQNKENPIFDSRLGQFGFQLQKPLNAKKTQTLSLRYTLTQTGLTNLAIPELVPKEDLHTRLSTLAAVWTRDTRDNPLDAHTGLYNSVELDMNPAIVGSNVNFAKLVAQAAAYKKLKGIVWANSLRVGFAAASSGSHVPLSQKFFSGGGSTLRGFPLNGAGPQTTVPVCSNSSDSSTCAFIQVPTGGTQLFILNSEFRIPLPLKKGLSFATFYDGGNVFDRIGFKNFAQQYSNSVGIGFRYATPVGPIRVDLGHNLSPLPGIKATQIFITLGQAF